MNWHLADINLNPINLYQAVNYSHHMLLVFLQGTWEYQNVIDVNTGEVGSFLWVQPNQYTCESVFKGFPSRIYWYLNHYFRPGRPPRWIEKLLSDLEPAWGVDECSVGAADSSQTGPYDMETPDAPEYMRPPMFPPLVVIQRMPQARCLHQNLNDHQMSQLTVTRLARWSQTQLNSWRAEETNQRPAGQPNWNGEGPGSMLQTWKCQYQWVQHEPGRYHPQITWWQYAWEELTGTPGYVTAVGTWATESLVSHTQ